MHQGLDGRRRHGIERGRRLVEEQYVGLDRDRPRDAQTLLLFNSAARRLPLSTLGFLQYLGPTCQFILAIAVYGEPFAARQLIAFGFIWLGLAIFSADLVRVARPASPVSRTGR